MTQSIAIRVFTFIVLGLIGQPFVAGFEVRTPAQQELDAARQRIERHPAAAEGYNALAMAHARRARETADSLEYDLAAAAVRRSRELQADNLGSRKAELWILLGKHDFSAALKLGKSLAVKAPDDLEINGMLVDAHVELGNYDDAEVAAQWMLDLRPGNIPGLTRASHLRELFGDVDGALELMIAAFERTAPHLAEDRAWVLTQVARLQRIAGKPGTAGRSVEAALALFPGYHYALAELARVRTDQGRHAEAAELLQRHVAAAPHPENFFYLGEALVRAGRVKEASAAFGQFEKLARAEINGVDNANRELVAYYTDREPRPDEALRIARLELERRRDVNTRTAHARALHAAGLTDDARSVILEVLAVGVRDPEILDFARKIQAGAPEALEHSSGL